MVDLTDAERACILGQGAAELFGLKVPESMRSRSLDPNATAGPRGMVSSMLDGPAAWPWYAERRSSGGRHASERISLTPGRWARQDTFSQTSLIDSVRRASQDHTP